MYLFQQNGIFPSLKIRELEGKNGVNKRDFTESYIIVREKKRREWKRKTNFSFVTWEKYVIDSAVENRDKLIKRLSKCFRS